MHYPAQAVFGGGEFRFGKAGEGVYGRLGYLELNWLRIACVMFFLTAQLRRLTRCLPNPFSHAKHVTMEVPEHGRIAEISSLGELLSLNVSMLNVYHARAPTQEDAMDYIRYNAKRPPARPPARNSKNGIMGVEAVQKPSNPSSRTQSRLCITNPLFLS